MLEANDAPVGMTEDVTKSPKFLECAVQVDCHGNERRRSC